MTRKEYIEQFTKYDNAYGACTWRVGLDSDCYHEKCSVCLSKEATINGQPAPYLFACPVKPGQTVYCVFKSGDISEDYIRSVSFIREDDCESYWECYGRNDYMIANSAGWMINCCPTRESAEKRMEELKS